MYDLLGRDDHNIVFQDEEKHTITTFNTSRIEVDLDFSTLVQLLRTRAHASRDKHVYTFLPDGETEQIHISYGEIDQRARTIAAHLQQRGMQGERALLLYPPGLEYIAAFFGCLYAGVIAVPVYPIRQNRNVVRLQSIVVDAQASIALTTHQLLTRTKTMFAEQEQTSILQWFATDTLPAHLSSDWHEENVTADTLAFLQYTSGSTGMPKGVMLTHHNLLANLNTIHRHFETTSQSQGVIWLPPYHDMGLIGGILQPLYADFPVTLMSPFAFLQRPFRWLEAISQTRATVSGGPNFAYELCMQKITDEQRSTLDLSSWSLAFNGAEPIRTETLEHFATMFASCGFRKEAFYTCYGLAEATLFASGGKKADPPVVQTFSKVSLEQNRAFHITDDISESIQLVSSGRPAYGQDIVIVNPQTLQRCASDEVGEIWVSGPGVAQGYWGRPDVTEQIFHACLTDNNEGPFLRTGDLGFLQHGELFVTGRLKDLIIIRGLNHYPQDIERTVAQSDPALRVDSGAAFTIEIAGEERLVIAQEIERHPNSDSADIIARIQQELAEEHNLQAYAVVLLRQGSIPKTSSGKIQRSACRTAFLTETLTVVDKWQEALPDATAQSDEPVWRGGDDSLVHTQAEIESWLSSQIARHRNVAVHAIDIARPITALGLDSLMAIELMNDIEANLSVRLSISDILEGPSITKLAEEIIKQLTMPSHENTSLALSQEQITYNVSYGQQALWFLDKLEPESAAYNIVSEMKLHGDLNKNAFRQSFQRILERHSLLQTTFTNHENGPISFRQQGRDIPIVEIDAAGWSQEEIDEYIHHVADLPFTLSEWPLFRLHLFQLGQQEYIFLFVIHHIISDLWSLALLEKEFKALYEAEIQRKTVSLPTYPLDYADFVSWQQQWLQGPNGEAAWHYWQQQLTLPLDQMVLNLPTDHPRPALQTHRGNVLDFALDATLTRQLQELGEAEHATLYMVLLAAFQTLLYRYTGQSTFLVGTPMTGRTVAGFAGIFGYFVNSVVSKAEIIPGASFLSILRSVRATTLKALQYQDYPFSLLVEKLQVPQDPSRSPLFQVGFNYQQTHIVEGDTIVARALGRADTRFTLGSTSVEFVEFKQTWSTFDLTFNMALQRDHLVGTIEYNADLFELSTIERLLTHWQVLLDVLVNDAGKDISRQPLLSPAEEHLLLQTWNTSRESFPVNGSLATMFEEQVARTPAAIAVVFEEQALTYQELHQRANQVAHFLLQHHVGADTFVCVYMERSIELIVGLLGILKAGGAYVPLDPNYPLERLEWIVGEVQPDVILTQSHLSSILAFSHARVVCLDTEWTHLSQEPTTDLNSFISPEQAVYLIYTSGSTGRPKGVVNTQRGVCNHLNWRQSAYTLTSQDTMILKTPYSFDVSIDELFWPLIAGARLVIAKPEGHKDSAYLLSLLAKSHVTTMEIVPSLLQVLLQNPAWEDCTALRQVVCGGEALSFELQERFFARSTAHLYNTYGPTEAAVDAASWTCVRESASVRVPIGRPIANTQIYVLDAYGQPVPINIPGELSISGEGLARGYLKRPDLTAERFVPNPFSQTPGARLYRTGDLARYHEDGTIEFLGRVDHQVKLRGFRIELGEIETLLQQHPSILQAVVLLQEPQPGNQRLIAYLIAKDQGQLPSVPDLRQHLRQILPEYMYPSAFVWMEDFPLLLSGKVDRRAFPLPHEEAHEHVEEPQTPSEVVLAALWKELLQRKQVNRYDNFFEQGGHSLLATQAVARLCQAFQIELPLRTLFEHPVLKDLALQVEDAERRQKHSSLPPLYRAIARTNELPLSFAQQRLWFLDQWEPLDVSYNMAGAVRLRGPLDVSAFYTSVHLVVQRHEILRTTFRQKDGLPYQHVELDLELPFAVIDLSPEDASDQRRLVDLLSNQEAQQAFDLAQGPLFRINMLRLNAQEYIVLLTFHHIIADGWSLGIFVRELTTLYQNRLDENALQLSPLPIQYADFAVWQREWLQGQVLEEQQNYWLKQLHGAPMFLELPTDHPYHAARHFRGASVPMEISVDLTQRMKKLCQQEQVTLFMLLLAAFQSLLFRYSGQEDILIGTPIANRTRTEIEGLIGFFVNTLVMRTDFSTLSTFTQVLRHVRTTSLAAYAHQDLPFEQLVDLLQIQRQPSRVPLVQVLFAWQNTPLSQVELPGIVVEPLPLDNQTAKFDLVLDLEEVDNQVKGTLQYSTDLFEPSTIDRLIQSFQVLLRSIVAYPDLSITEHSLLTSDEQRALLKKTNRMVDRNTAFVPLISRFEAQVASTPDAIALVYEHDYLTYIQLNQQANRLARILIQRGIRQESLIGLMLERSPMLIIAILAVLKAGGAYLPLDPTYPLERLHFMLEDSHASLLLTNHLANENWQSASLPLLDLSTIFPLAQRQSDENLTLSIDEEQLAYVIYTSGSTGRPKGVMISHRALANHMNWVQDTFTVTQVDRMLYKTAMSFDASIWECYATLMVGGQLHLARPGSQQDSAYLVQTLLEQQITMLQVVPTLLQMLLNEPDFAKGIHLRHLFCGGEALSSQLWQQVTKLSRAQLHNLYGPTETTIDATWFSPDGAVESAMVPIGAPITNMRAYILDTSLHLVPAGIAGELYLAGRGIARGYLYRPDATAERFLPDPFGDIPGARMYRTGDQARLRADGSLEYLGRLDQQVKLRGFRIELGEIESLLQQHAVVQQAVVVVQELQPGDQRLVSYVLAHPSKQIPSDQELRHYLKQSLPDYMLPSVFTWMEAFPHLPNGKLDRRNLPLPVAEDLAIVDPPVTPREDLVAGIWREILQVKNIRRYDNFFELGGHSLLATQVVARLRQTFQIEIPLRTLFLHPVLAELAAQVESIQHDRQQSLPALIPIVRNEELPLSFAQRGIWFLDQLAPGNSAYNIFAAIRLSGKLDMQILQMSVDQVVLRHESLRTTFLHHDGRPYQYIQPTLHIPIRVVDVRKMESAAQYQVVHEIGLQETHFSFDLAHGPLARLHVLRLHEQEHILLLNIHHIVSDGWSMTIFVRELTMFYQHLLSGKAPAIAALPIQYVDFAAWQRAWLQGETLRQQQDYWLEQLRGAPMFLELPTDHPRPVTQRFRGDRVAFQISTEHTQQLKAICQQEQVTLFMLFLTIFSLLLAYYSSQEDILIGTDVANRYLPETELLIGFFVNQVVLRTNLAGNPTVRAFLQQTRLITLQAYDHQDLSFEQVVDLMRTKRSMSHTPLFQVKLVLLNTPALELRLPGLAIEPFEIPDESSKFDITLFLQETANGIEGSWNYDTDLFEKATAVQMVAHFEKLIQDLPSQLDVHLNALQIETKTESRRQTMVQEKSITTGSQLFKKIKPKAVALPEQEPVQIETLSSSERLPLMVKPAIENVDLVDWTKGNLELIQNKLLEHGAILFRNFHIDNPLAFERLAQTITPELFDENGEHPRESVSGKIYTPTFFPKEKQLLWHNENSYNYRGPQRIWFACVQPAETGGETTIVDSRKMFELLDPLIRDEFVRKQVMYVRNYGGGTGLDWQEVFRTSDRAVVEKLCRQQYMKFEWYANDRLRTSCIRPAVLTHPQTGEQCWFNQAQHWHTFCLDSTTGESLLSVFGEESLPRTCYFGDGTPIPDSAMDEICKLYRQLEIGFPWQKGDVMVLDNILTAHGRNPFTGTRKILVALGDMINYV